MKLVQAERKFTAEALARLPARTITPPIGLEDGQFAGFIHPCARLRKGLAEEAKE